MDDREVNEIFKQLLANKDQAVQLLGVKGLCINYEGRNWLRENGDKYPNISKEIKKGLEEHHAFPSVTTSSIIAGNNNYGSSKAHADPSRFD